MAKLKFGELTLEPGKINKIQPTENPVDVPKLATDLKLPQLKQSLHRLSKDISDINAQLLSNQNQIDSKVADLRSELIALTTPAATVDDEKLYREIDLLHNNFNKQFININQKIKNLEKQVEEFKLKKPEIKKEIIEKIEVEKDNSEQLNKLQDSIDELRIKNKEHKVKIKNASNGQQDVINWALGGLLVVSLILHLL